MQIRLTDYLGRPASDILKSEPFNLWRFKRSVDKDLPEIKINYSSSDKGFSIVCDKDEKIRSIFMEADKFDQGLFEILFSSKRSEILSILGKATKSGDKYDHIILGKYGPWDRFDGVHYSIHVEYRPDADEIRRVTLMRADVIP